MSVTAAALRELHRIHQQLAELRDRLERGPKQVRAREANVAQLEAKLAEARDRAKQTQMAVDRKQLDLKAGEQKVVDLRVKLNAANSNRNTRRCSSKSPRPKWPAACCPMKSSKAMEKVDELQLGVKEAEKNAGRRQAGTGKDAPGRRRLGRLDPRRHRRASKRARRRPKQALPADLKADYQRVVRSKGADSLAVGRRRRLHRLRPADHAQHAERAEALEARVLQVVRLLAVSGRR